MTGIDDHFWRFRWTREGLVELVDHSAVTGDRLTVARVWVAKTHRQKRLARRLVELGATALGTSPADLGWVIPLSGDGRKLVRSLCPVEWLGRGDCDAVESTLGPGAQ
jgi:hypothetical protein